MKIRRLSCHIRIVDGNKESISHKEATPSKPELVHLTTAEEPRQGGQVEPSRSATEERNPATGRKPVSAKNADPKVIADKVYDLMMRDARAGRLREGR